MRTINIPVPNWLLLAQFLAPLNQLLIIKKGTKFVYVSENGNEYSNTFVGKQLTENFKFYLPNILKVVLTSAIS